MDFSEGFHPRPRFSIASPLALGISSDEEYMDVELRQDMDPEEFKERLNSALPKDIQILEARICEDSKTVASLITWAKYNIIIKQEDPIDIDTIKSKLENWLKNQKIIIERIRKKRRQKIMVTEDIRGHIGDVRIVSIEKDFLEVEALLKTGSVENLRPFDFIEAMMRDNDLDGGLDLVEAKRIKLLIGHGEEVF